MKTQMSTAEKAARHPATTAQLMHSNHQMFIFPEGILAFEDVKQFMFICKPETSPFVFMRALDPAYLGFVCVNPFLICPDYQPHISAADTAILELATPKEVMLLSIVNPAPDARDTTANLQGPLAINLRTGRGKQILCDGQNFPVRYAFWEILEQLDDQSRLTTTERLSKRSAA